MRDTLPAADDVLREVIQRMPPAERVRQALAFSESVRLIAMARLRRDHPHLPEPALVARLMHDRSVNAVV